MTKRLVTESGLIRNVTLSDLIALFPGGAQASLGIPRKVTLTREQVVVVGTVTRGEIRVTPSGVLPEGHIYLIKPSDLVAKLIHDQVPDPSGVVAWRVSQTVSAAAQTALARLDFIPLVYVAGAVQRGTTMPKPAHCKITFSGVFGSAGAPAEIWSWGLTFRDIPAHGGTTQALADKAAGLYASTGLAALMAPHVIMTKARVAFLGDGAHVNKNEDGVFDQADNLVPVPGTYSAASNYLPLQTALCVSFSSLRQDSSGKGRAFLPLQGVEVASDYLVSPVYCAQLGGRLQRLCEGMEDATGPHVGQHAVMSGKGFASDVTTYRVGRVPDTMRSRRGDLLEAYVAADPTA